LNLILFKAADSSREIYEVAMQLLQVREVLRFPAQLNPPLLLHLILSLSPSLSPQILEPKLFRYAHKLEIQRADGILTPPSPLPHLYSVSYYQLSEELARTYPELTLPIFSGETQHTHTHNTHRHRNMHTQTHTQTHTYTHNNTHTHTQICIIMSPEVSQRIQTAHPGGRQVMLHYLLPWMNNVELVDFKAAARRPDDGGGEEDERDTTMVNSRRWLRGEGWGSPRATSMVLNNLMFMTAKVSGAGGPRRGTEDAFGRRRCASFGYFTDLLSAVRRRVRVVGDRERLDHAGRQLAEEPEDHPALPHRHFGRGQRAQPPALRESRVPIMHCVRRSPLVFLTCVCPQVKRVVVYLGRDKTMQLLEELMSELELTEPVCSAVTHMDNPPFYRISSSHKVPSVTSGERAPPPPAEPRVRCRVLNVLSLSLSPCPSLSLSLSLSISLCPFFSFSCSPSISLSLHLFLSLPLSLSLSLPVCLSLSPCLSLVLTLSLPPLPQERHPAPTPWFQVARVITTARSKTPTWRTGTSSVILMYIYIK